MNRGPINDGTMPPPLPGRLPTATRRMALQQLIAAVGAASGLGACGGGAGEGTPLPPAPAPPAPSPPAPAPSPPASAPPPAPLDAVGRLKKAMSSGVALTVSSTPMTVTQGITNRAEPSQGLSAVILPTPLGPSVNPNPDSLANLPQLWGRRRDTWSLSASGYAGTSIANQGWVRAVKVAHVAQMQATSGVCGLHFIFDGRSFDVLFGGNAVQVTVVADGKYMAPRHITSNLSGGVAGAPFTAYDTYVRFDFGSAAVRHVSFYGRATFGPCAIAVGSGDTLRPWDRSDEPSMCVMGDSYAQVRSANWGVSGLYWEAASMLGIPHLDANGVGGTGYAPNNANPDTRNPVNAFGARLTDSVAAVPDLFITAGGINDNNGGAALPLYATDADAKLGFDTAVANYFRDLRAALPGSVLAAIGPWQPNVAFYPAVALAKADTIRASLQAVTGPWVFIDNLRGGWVNSSGASAPATGAAWQTGTGRQGAPTGDGNGDLYLSPDGTHPNDAGTTYLAEQLAANLRAAVLAL